MISPDAADLMGGDFSSFYVAGEIVLDGDIDRLYEPGIQQIRQSGYHADPSEFLFFAYPPFVAMAYALIAWLPYPVAFAVQSLASLAFLVLAVSMMTRVLTLRSSATRAIVVGVALSLLVFPIATAVLGGQNTTFTLMLVLAAFSVAPIISSPIAGIAAGTLFYKPQFGLLVVLVLTVGRRWRSVAVAGFTVAVLYLIVVPWLGWSWPEHWLAAVSAFGAENQRVNGSLMVNAMGWWREIAPRTPWVGALAVVLVSVPTLLLAYRTRLEPASAGLISAWLILASASALFYDAGIALVVFGLFVLLKNRPLWLIPLVIVASWTQPITREFGWSSLFVIVCVIWVYQLGVLVWFTDTVSLPVGTLARPSGTDQDR